MSDKTLRDIAQALEGFEPSAHIEVERVAVTPDLEALVLAVQAPGDAIPFTFHGRPYERVQSTTRKMPQKRYEQLLLDRAHSKRRWENQVAEEIGLRGLPTPSRSEVSG